MKLTLSNCLEIIYTWMIGMDVKNCFFSFLPVSNSSLPKNLSQIQLKNSSNNTGHTWTNYPNPYRNSIFPRSEGKTDLFLYHSTSAKNTSAKPSPAIAIQGHSMVHNVVASIKDATVVVEPKCYVFQSNPSLPNTC